MKASIGSNNRRYLENPCQKAGVSNGNPKPGFSQGSRPRRSMKFQAQTEKFQIPSQNSLTPASGYRFPHDSIHPSTEAGRRRGFPSQTWTATGSRRTIRCGDSDRSRSRRKVWLRSNPTWGIPSDMSEGFTRNSRTRSSGRCGLRRSVKENSDTGVSRMDSRWLREYPETRLRDILPPDMPRLSPAKWLRRRGRAWSDSQTKKPTVHESTVPIFERTDAS